MAQVFDALAPAYGTVVGFFDHYGRRLVELAGIEPGMLVLDVAAGRGASARPVQALGAEVVAVDIAPGMVERLRAAGVDARVMDGEQLDFPDQSFDAVLCGFGLFFFPDSVQGAREFKRVVKPGGPVACSMPVKTFPEFLTAIRKEFEARAAAGGIPEPRTAFDGAAVLNAAGFADVEVLDDPWECTFESGAHLWDFLLSTGARNMVDRLSQADAEDMRERIVDAAGDRPFASAMSARFWLTSG